MEPRHLLQVLQLHDSFFPTGAFAFSDGLESAVAQQQVRNGADLDHWMAHYLHSGFLPCEGLAFHRTCLAYLAGNWQRIQILDRELTALKPSASVRMSSQVVGKSFLNTCLPLYPHQDLEKIMEAIQQHKMHGNAAVVYALVLTVSQVPEREALSGYGYSCLAAIVSAALRLIAIGQQEGQTLLAHYLNQLPALVDSILRMNPQTPLTLFHPLLDIRQMSHRHLHTRLFRS